MTQPPSSALHTYYKLLFLRIEPLVLVISTTIYLLAPAWTSHTLFASFIELITTVDTASDAKATHPATYNTATNVITSPLTYLLIGYFLNMTCIIAGIQYRLLETLSYSKQQWFIFCLAYGDVGHIWITYHHILSQDTASLNPINWPLGVHLNIMTTIGLFVSRVGWYLGGQQYDLSRSTTNASKVH